MACHTAFGMPPLRGTDKAKTLADLKKQKENKMNNKLKKLHQQIELKCGKLYCFTETTTTLKGKYITISYNDIFTIDFNNNSLRIELKTISSVIDFIVNNIADDFTTRLDLFPICK